MTKQELLENGEWMNAICDSYGITKENIADQCQIYACTDKILTLPFYSVFEDKYVYLPMAFVEHIYSANGCCVGNTREEAWVHALSEILERHSNIEMIKNKKGAPIIPREELKKFKTVDRILKRIESKGVYDVQVLDYSCGTDFPVIATRIINKETKGYLINVGADPVLEIAIERTLTEIFQGRNLNDFTSSHNGMILNKMSDIGLADNILNQLETGNGVYSIDYFTDECEAVSGISNFPDNTNKDNRQLLDYILGIYKKIGLPVYVRNNSFLGFPCYLFVIPGYSESRGERLTEQIPSYYFGDRASKTLRNIKKASMAQLSELLMYHKMINNIFSKRNNITYLSGLPKHFKFNAVAIHLAYASLKLKNISLFNKYIDEAILLTHDKEDKDYLMAVKQWLHFGNNGVSEEKRMAVIKKFYFSETVQRLERNLNNETLLDEFLIECNPDNCAGCKNKDGCNYENIRKMIKAAGQRYEKFTNGQAKENFEF